MSPHTPADLQRIYQARFHSDLEYRQQAWRILTAEFFHSFIGASDTVLDLGCGYGEFIRQIQCGRKYAMDLNPDAPARLGPEIQCFVQDCSIHWPLPDGHLNVVFTSNFFEHLPDKAALGRTLDEIRRCLKPGGRLIALGPNIRYLHGAYWDFWDHHLPLTERSLGEALVCRGFHLEICRPKFLPYSMAQGIRYPLIFLRLYLRLKPAWTIWGRQFLIVAARD